MIERNAANRRKKPHTTVEAVSARILPDFAHRLLFSAPEQFPVARFFAGAAFGALSGAGLFVVLTHNIPMSVLQRLISAYVFVGLCILGGAFSSYFRCSVSLIFPCLLSSRGRAFVMLFVLYGLYQGPIANISRNVQDVAFSMGCNIDLQITHSKVMWKVMINPLMELVQDVVGNKEVLQEEAKDVTRKFQIIRDEIMGEYGYGPLADNLTETDKSTQEQFVSKTKLRCDYVVQQGIENCQEWFHVKWQECMEAISAPLINHILCLPMQFHFLCDIVKLMTPWCVQEIPVEGNFGQAYDKLNDSISRLGEDFNTEVVYEETKQESLMGANFSQEAFTQELAKAFEEKMIVAERILDIFQVLLYFTFIFVFFSAYGYIRQYNEDICFDNMYITKYFRQIDARRKKAGKRHLLPLKKAERPNFINPWNIYIHPCELKCMALGLLQVVSLGVCAALLLAVDRALYHVFDVIGKNSVIDYSFTSGHHLDIKVGGESMLAKLLRKTVNAFNTSSTVDIKSSNKNCLPHPRALTTEEYLWNIIPLLIMALMCCLQVYTNRLRRVIAAFYFPKREKKRTLFLYNLQIRRRMFYVKTQHTRLLRHRKQKTIFSELLSVFGFLGLNLHWCCVCGEFQRGDGPVWCPQPGCQVVYCPQCWKDLGRFCFACATTTYHSPEEEEDMQYYYAE